MGRAARLAAALLATIPFFPRSVGRPDRDPREIRAIAAIRAIHTAETEYYFEFGRYASSMAELDFGNAPPARDFRFTVTQTPGGYAISAIPSFQASRTFYSDQTMVVREHDGPGPATAQDSELR